jgi:hypothetical protein
MPSSNAVSALAADQERASKADNNLVALGTPAHWLAEGEMKRVLFAAAALAVLSIGANARDDRLPANFVGDWCFAEHRRTTICSARACARALWGLNGWRGNEKDRGLD